MPPADPNTPGLLGRLFPGNDPAALYTGALSDPATQAQMNQRGLLAMAGSFADSAMPTRMPTPLGAVLGHAAAALGASGDQVMAARLQAAQSQQALAQAQLTEQDVNVSKMMPGLLDAYNRTGNAIPGTAAAAAVPVTGTIGAPLATTAPVDAGSGPPGVTIPPGTPTATFDPKLPGTQNINNLVMAAAPIALPPGYTIKMTSGDRPGAIAPGGGPSQHATANAADFQIFKPDGSKVNNEGPDTTGLYGKLALTARKIADPAIKPWLAWGGNFSTASGQRDLMHFDFAGDRGHFGNLAAMEQQFDAQNAAKPVQVAQRDTGTMTDAGPAGAAPGPPPPLGPSGQTIAQLANQAMADRPAVPGGLLNPAAPGPPPGAPPPGAPPPPQVAAAPPGPPQSLIPAPQAAPALPPAARPQPPPAAAAPTIPGAPSPERIALAQKISALFTAMRRPVPPEIAATATYGLDIAKAAGTAAATSPIEVAKAVAIAQQTLPFEIAKATAPQSERGAQARLTYANEVVEIPGLGYVQRKNLPGFTLNNPGVAAPSIPGPAPATPAIPAPGPTAAVPGPGAPATPAPGQAAPSNVPILAPSTTPAQAKVFENTLAQATEQLKPIQAEGLAAPQQITNAEQITDLLGRTAMGWGADAKQEAAMIMRGLGVSDENIKKFTAFGGTSADPTIGGTLNKMFLKFSSDAVLRLGTREAASVLGQFAKTYPSLESDPKAAELMTNALRMEAQWRLDRANAADEWNANQKKNMGPFGQNYHGMDGFQASFNKTNDPINYWRAALAMSGFSDLAFRGTSKGDPQRAAIFAHIPAGRKFIGADGQPYIKPGAQ